MYPSLSPFQLLMSLSIPPNYRFPQIANKKLLLSKISVQFFKNLEMTNITDKDNLENIVNHVETSINQAWTKNTEHSRILKHSKQWWMEECSKSLDNYRMTRSLENWKTFKRVVKNTKQSFFNLKIQKVANKSHGP